MMIVNHLLRGSGAFYMRRSFASDVFYRSIFTEYVQQILQVGERPIEFFPEGTRSRCGKALQPKVGMCLRYYARFFTRNVYICCLSQFIKIFCLMDKNSKVTFFGNILFSTIETSSMGKYPSLIFNGICNILWKDNPRPLSLPNINNNFGGSKSPKSCLLTFASFLLLVA